ncbi:MAG: hypothetical protein MK008_10190 [Bdellovibrionales bacterium]|nr:hypothetical protein [Bdellovibrionales bacterium]
MLTKEQLKDIEGLTNLYVSAHNTQPAQWLYNNGHWILTEDVSRKLPVADESSKDHLISLGSSVESLNIALSKYKYQLVNTYMEFTPSFRAEYKMINCEEKDPLLAYLNQRKSYRGVFKKASADKKNKLIDCFSSDENIVLVTDNNEIKTIAEDFDKANYHFLSQQDYLSELYSWLRFNRNESNFFEDGLTPDAMSLNALESMGAKFILRPNIFQKLKKIKIAPILISEKTKICSATAIAFIIAPKEMDLLDQGRLFYRKWLEMTKIGFSLNPLSCLVDWPKTYSIYKNKLRLDDQQIIVNAFRVGPTPNKLPGRYRRPLQSVFQESL